MKRAITNFWALLLCTFMVVHPEQWALAHQDDTDYGRIPITWPDLGHEGGSVLHTKIVDGITKLSNNTAARWSGDLTVANSGSTTVTHNFNLALTKLKVLIFEAGVQRTAAQVAADYTISQTSVNAYSITNVSGGSKTFQVMTLAFLYGITATDFDPAVSLDTTGTVRANALRSTADSGLVLNHDAAASGADWTATLARDASSMTAAGTYTLPTSTATLVGDTSTQTLTNKTLSTSAWNGGTASSSQYITLPSATLTTLQALARTAGKLYYATDTTTVYYDNGSSLLPVGSGSGSGGINYISANTDFETNQSTGYVLYDDGASATPVNGFPDSGTITSTITPRTTAGFTGTYASTTTAALRGSYSLEFVKTAVNLQGEGYAFAFTTHAADKSVPLQISFDYDTNSGYVASDMGVYIYDVTNSTLISPSLVNIPAGKNKFTATFGATTSNSYRLIFHTQSVSAVAYALKFDNIEVGPKTLANVPAISDWRTDKSISAYSAAFGTTTNASFIYRQVGDSMIGRVYVKVGTAANSVASMTLPTGITIDATKQFSIAGSNILGRAQRIRTGGTPAATQLVEVFYDGTDNTKIFFSITGASDALSKSNGTEWFTTSDEVYVEFTIPVSNWSSNVSLASSSVEYLYATDTTGTSTTTGFGYGAEGALIPNRTVGTSVVKRIRSQYPIQNVGALQLEVFDPTIGIWFLYNQRFTGFIGAASGTHGVRMYPVSGSNTDIDVEFGKYGTDLSGGINANGGNWSDLFTTGYKWRVKKSSGLQNVPLSGAYYGVTDGSNDAGGGVIGEYKEVVTGGVNAGATGVYVDFGNLVLTPGDWDVSISAQINTGNNFTGAVYGISTTSGNSSVGLDDGNYAVQMNQVFTVAGTLGATLPVRRFSVSTTTTIYGKFNATYTGTTPQIRGRMSARRVR